VTPRYRVFAVLGNIVLPFSGPFLPVVNAAPSRPPGAVAGGI
jgi:hypothetical protein